MIMNILSAAHCATSVKFLFTLVGLLINTPTKNPTHIGNSGHGWEGDQWKSHDYLASLDFGQKRYLTPQEIVLPEQDKSQQEGSPGRPGHNFQSCKENHSQLGEFQCLIEHLPPPAASCSDDCAKSSQFAKTPNPSRWITRYLSTCSPFSSDGSHGHPRKIHIGASKNLADFFKF
ncbi:hypothetical protein J6590_061062 [Homalodisca vitripennis]|nr:hypothetical protein J6590_061062 [Homalodisca vitripennis]